MTDDPRTDALLALGVLVVYLASAVAAGVDPSPGAALAGVLALVGFEAVAGRYEAVVEGLWRRPAVKVVSIVVALGFAVVGLRVAPDATLTFGAATLVAYLVLLALVQTGRLPPPRDWIR